MDLSVIIVNWNALGWLERCLGSALAQDTGGRSFDIWVVDNASTDGSVAFLKERFPEVHLLALADNRGFAAGNNVAIRECEGRAILLLNPDTESHPGAFKAMLDFLESHPSCGIVGPKLLNPDGSLQYSCRHFPTVEAGLFRGTALGKLFPGNAVTSDYLMKDVSHDAPMAVDWVSGSAFMTRRAVFDDIGLLDEGYFFAVEEVDFCYRAREAGWETWYEPAGVITHAIGHSSDQRPIPIIIAHHKGMYRFFRQHYIGTRYPRWMTPVVAAGVAARAGMTIALGYWYWLRGRRRK